MSKLNKNEKLCRICLKDDKFKISIFCEYAEKANIHSRIQKYLKIDIKQNECYPKYICYQCVSNLEFVENFINKAHTSQKTIKGKDGTETFYEDDSLQTPPHDFIKTDKMSRHFGSGFGQKMDFCKSKVTVPKIKSFFSDDEDSSPECKKPKTMDSNRDEVKMKGGSSEKVKTVEKKLSLIRSYNDKFKGMRKPS